MQYRRSTQPPIPENYAQFLNAAQLGTIGRMEKKGWKLFFIRRPFFEEVITIMQFPETGETALIERNGSVNMAHEVHLRN